MVEKERHTRESHSHGFSKERTTKTVINKSLVSNYFYNGKVVPQWHDNLNSNRKYQNVRNHENKQGKTFNFTFTPEGTDIKITRTISELTSIDDPEIISWVEEFREIAATNAWNEQSAVIILKSVTDKSLWKVFSQKQSCDTCLDAILDEVFPERKKYFYEEEIRKIKQKKYFLINDYLQDLKTAFKKYCLCTKMKGREQSERFEEYFYQGLDDVTKIELEKLGIYETEPIIKKIKALEQLLLEKKERGFEFIKLESKLSNLNIYPSSVKKYCNFHKTNKHDNSDCRRNQQKTYERKAQSNMHMSDKSPRNDILRTVVEINNSEVEAVLDTGATSNYIGSEMIESLKIQEGIRRSDGNCEVGDGRAAKIIGKMDLNLCLKNFNNLLSKEEFKIIQGSFRNVILGNTFLKKHKVKIDYENMIVNIENNLYSYNTDNFDEWRESLDKLLVDKVLNINEKEQEDKYKLKLQTLLANYINTNPPLGRIPNAKFDIKLHDSTPFTHTPYPIPYKSKESVRQELSRLLQLGIIRKSSSNYLSPAFPIGKRDGGIRWVVDYRRLNRQTEKDSDAFPSLWDELRSIKKSKYFSQLDLAQGYHQLEISEDSQKFTAFITELGKFECTRVSFGLTNAPRHFQRVMRNILGHFEFCKIFLDDILIHSSSLEEHLTHIETILEELKKNT